MADNTRLRTGFGGDVLATDDLVTLNGAASSGVKAIRGKTGFGSDGILRDVDATNGLPIELITGAVFTFSGNVAAGAAGTTVIGPLDVTDLGTVSFVIKNQVAATPWTNNPVVVFEQSDDGVSWSPLMVIHDDEGQVVTSWTFNPNTANQAHVFEAALEGVIQVRASVTVAPVGGGMTVGIRAGVLPFVTQASTSDRHNTGRTPWSWSVEAINHTTETTITMTLSSGVGAATTTGSSYTVPAGKTLRIQSIHASVISSSTNLVTTKIRLRATTSGTASNLSPIFLSFPRLASRAPAVANNSGIGVMSHYFPEGLEFTAGQSIAMTDIMSVNSALLEILLTGYLY